MLDALKSLFETNAILRRDLRMTSRFWNAQVKEPKCKSEGIT